MRAWQPAPHTNIQNHTLVSTSALRIAFYDRKGHPTEDTQNLMACPASKGKMTTERIDSKPSHKLLDTDRTRV